MPKPGCIELPTGERIPILYEDRSVLAIDKPPGWMLVPFSWQNTNRNLQAALASSIAAGDFWARSRGLRFLRFIHRLDAETSGILLLAKSPGALRTFSGLFESRKVEKTYLAVVQGAPRLKEWTCRLKLGPDPTQRGRMKVDPARGKEAETNFRVLNILQPPRPGPRPGSERDPQNTRQTRRGGCPTGPTALVQARPVTGRTHQIRVHLAETGHPVVGDDLYGVAQGSGLGLRAVELAYADPFNRRPVRIRAPVEEFLKDYGFGT